MFEEGLGEKERISILLISQKDSFLHGIMLGYDAEKKEWSYEDPNKPTKTFSDENLLYQEILDSYLNDTSQQFLYYLYAANPQTAKKIEIKIPAQLTDCSNLSSSGATALKEAIHNNDYAGFIALLQKNASLSPKDETFAKLNNFAFKLSLIEKYYTPDNPQRAQALKDIQLKIMESYGRYLQNGDAMAAFDKLIKDVTDIKDQVAEDHKKHGTFSNISLFGKSFSLTSSQLAGHIQIILDEAAANRTSLTQSR